MAGPAAWAMFGWKQRAEPDRQEGAADGVHHADEQRAQQRAAHRADAADDDDHQGQDQDRVAHAGLHRQDRPRHQAGEAGQPGAEREDQAVQRLDVDAERRHHRRVGGAGADQHADAGPVDQPVEADRDREADDDDREAVGGVGVAEQVDGAGEPLRRGHVDRRRAPDHPDQLVEEQDQAEGRQHLVEVVTAVEPLQRHLLDDEAEQRGGRHRDQRAEQERAGPAGGHRARSTRPSCTANRAPGSRSS